MRNIRFGGRTVPLPGHPVIRILLGCLLILGGFLGFLPVLGFWMVPLGLIVLAVDIPIARRLKRRLEVRLGRWLIRRSPKWARRFGFSVGREAP
jgi:purine-cytosine permease-like protein